MIRNLPLISQELDYILILFESRALVLVIKENLFSSSSLYTLQKMAFVLAWYCLQLNGQVSPNSPGWAYFLYYLFKYAISSSACFCGLNTGKLRPSDHISASISIVFSQFAYSVNPAFITGNI